MLKRAVWILCAASVLNLCSLRDAPGIFAASSYGAMAAAPAAMDSGNPDTGEHPAPILAAMGLAFSGVAIVLLIEKKEH